MEKENEVDNFDERNIENLIKFYEKELRRIHKGEDSAEVFTGQKRAKLRDIGILTFVNRTWVIADRAMKYLRLDK